MRAWIVERNFTFMKPLEDGTIFLMVQFFSLLESFRPTFKHCTAATEFEICTCIGSPNCITLPNGSESDLSTIKIRLPLDSNPNMTHSVYKT